MITIGEASVAKDVNWNIVVQYLLGIGAVGFILFTFWDRVKKCFFTKQEGELALARIEALESENHEQRVRLATLEKTDGKLDQILDLVKKRRSND